MNKINCKFYQGCTFGCYFCEKHGRILPEFCSRCSDRKAKNKYNNVKTVVDGIKFDSKKESARYQELSLLEKKGMIKNLERQKRFEVVPKTETERAVFYVADFVYLEVSTNKLICEDVKSDATRKDKAYIIKRKLFKYIYKNYEFREY